MFKYLCKVILIFKVFFFFYIFISLWHHSQPFLIISIDSCVCQQKKRADQSCFKREFTEKVVSLPSWKIGRPRKKSWSVALPKFARRPTDLGARTRNRWATRSTQPFACERERESARAYIYKCAHCIRKCGSVRFKLSCENKNGVELRYPLWAARARLILSTLVRHAGFSAGQDVCSPGRPHLSCARVCSDRGCPR